MPMLDSEQILTIFETSSTLLGANNNPSTPKCLPRGSSKYDCENSLKVSADKLSLSFFSILSLNGFSISEGSISNLKSNL